MGVERHTSVDQLAREWDELADRTGVEPFLRAGWVGAWWRAFGAGSLELWASRDGAALTAVLPVVRRRGGLVLPVNWHTPVFGATAVDADAAHAVYTAALGARPVYASFRFLDRDDTPPLDALGDRGYDASVRTLLESPYLPLDGGWDALPVRPREKELARRWRKLDALGGAELDVRDGSTGLPALLEEGFAAEGSGWKTEQGTAILSRPETRRFYTEVAEWAAKRGTLRLFFLRVGGRAVAFELGLEDVGRYYFVKGGYDPEFRSHAPGLLMMREVVRWACDRGLRTFEFLGAPDPQKLAWTSLLRERVAVDAFAPGAAGRAARLAYRHGRPLAKRAVTAVRRRG